jgi:hypothetical protein
VVGGGGGLARFDSNGVLDTAFGTGGSLATTFALSGVLIQTNGNIVAVGGHENAQTGVTTLSISRYWETSESGNSREEGRSAEGFS